MALKSQERTEGEPSNLPARKQESPWALLRTLERWFPLLPRPAQVVVALVVVGMLAVYVLHGFIARTYIRGQLFLVDQSGARIYAQDFSVVYDGKEVFTDRYGSWFFPISNGGIPGRLTIEVGAPPTRGEGPRDARLTSFTVIGPIPIFHALSEMNYRVLLFPDRTGDDRIKVAEARGAPITVAHAYAADDLSDRKSVTEVPLRTSQVLGPVRGVVLMVLDSLLVKRIRRSSLGSQPRGRAYFGVSVNGERVSDTDLLWDRSSGSQQQLFPVQKIPSSWLQVYQGEPVRLRGIAANFSRVLEETAERGRYVTRGSLSIEVYVEEERVASFLLPRRIGFGDSLAFENEAVSLVLRPSPGQ